MADTVETLRSELDAMKAAHESLLTAHNVLKTEFESFQAYALPVINGHQQATIPQREWDFLMPPPISHTVPLNQPPPPDVGSFPPAPVDRSTLDMFRS